MTMHGMQWVAAVMAIWSSGCATFTYTSASPANVVSQCIATRWRSAGAEGYQVPISVARQEHGYFVAFAIQKPFFSPLITGQKHPTYAVWAEVTESDPGSVTEYHRAFQFTHARIDRAVQECQEPVPGSR